MTKELSFKAGKRTKSAMKGSLKGLARVAGAARRPTGAENRILTYHSVGERDHEMNVTPKAFREQMTWLADHFSVVSVEEALSGDGQIALTFDDGYHNNVVNAAPVLKELGLPATFFVVTGHMGGLLDLDRDVRTGADESLS